MDVVIPLRERQRSSRRAGLRSFTLVELILVLLIVGILAALATSRTLELHLQSQTAAMMRTVDAVRNKIEIYVNEHGHFPTALPGAWFHGGRVENAFDPDHPVPILVQNITGKFNVSTKFIASNCAMWYNRANGAFAARVPRQSSNVDTLALYNRVNRCDCPSMSYTGP